MAQRYKTQQVKPQLIKYIQKKILTKNNKKKQLLF